ncbi:MAG: hypothetical protein ACD_24C00081G0002 [uncultured bacterium]|uniref:Small ribosomal subunit protein bS6 n=1 Tax=Candidatus Woesebacteria bacterium RIFCSPHIGHO2_12_FULL_41_24 TaxID=1802510 RepID=A0A1F8AS95_9BACT|nr:MAG: hypothetical protein ACD_24C00081G0002 [uncultured bacterium]OGM13426.1 MAG: hypothetical protein A2W15_06030 [Candidatus Woesebacteria bacterium RBG_16_41_13]OGM29831.1 MAG: hypothetical protein A2873_04305 [Candidatus Woesebacteria bacterium RIFCSPHIGHO2_01_FULL_42_80]OGM35970.1 MAG: hypothetical protein A3D84_01820 [Candidatus Woesebacteria bacterium RIFCSPHIGHO2_02_FULL_42_20]OGM54138.1 MAG: hypothetical protein A3E44_00440 [Candidatus Woesebacteria bacterium RIFCSPHIGHO2_12_FULL_41
MNTYELTVVLPDKATPAKSGSAKKLVTKLVEVLDGKVKNVEDWGTKDLFFDMKKKGAGSKKTQTGTFLHFTLELKSETVKKLDEKIRLEDDFVRYLLVRA